MRDRSLWQESRLGLGIMAGSVGAHLWLGPQRFGEHLTAALIGFGGVLLPGNRVRDWLRKVRSEHARKRRLRHARRR